MKRICGVNTHEIINEELKHNFIGMILFPCFASCFNFYFI